MNLICGINPVLEALNAGTRHFERLLVVKGVRNRRINEAIAAASKQGVALRFESRETLDRISSGVPHQGLVAVVSAKAVLGLHELLAHKRDPALFVVLDGVEDPRNLGAILRTSEAAGADGVVLPERHSAGLTEIVARASAGALEYVRVARVGNLSQALDELKASGVWVVGFDASGQERWDTVDLKGPVALVLGGEGKGIRRLVREKCDHLVSLPLFGHVGSLNVSVAAGIALYEVVRQRGTVPSHARPIPLKPATHAPSIVGPQDDDVEHDPGRHASHPRAEDVAAWAAEAPGDDSSVHIQEEEDVAWGTGGSSPTVVHGGVHRRGRWGREGGGGGGRGRPMKNRRRGGSDARPAGGPPSAPSPASTASAPPNPQDGRAAMPSDIQRKRRKGRRGRGRPEDANGVVSAAQPRAESSAPRAENSAPGASEPNPSGPAAAGSAEQKRRKGRRRRRGGGRPNPPPSSGGGAAS